MMLKERRKENDAKKNAEKKRSETMHSAMAKA